MPQTRHNLLTTWLLTLTIIMTPWISFWATPVLAHNQQGEIVVLCTLNGLQRVAIKPAESGNSGLYSNGTIVAEPIAIDQQPCSVVQLIKAFSQGLVFTTPALPDFYYPIGFTHSREYTSLSKPPFSAYRGRAPPFA